MLGVEDITEEFAPQFAVLGIIHGIEKCSIWLSTSVPIKIPAAWQLLSVSWMIVD
jgi:hypothetical protein